MFHRNATTFFLLSTVLGSTVASAQDVVFLTDSGNDYVVRCVDQNQNGSFNDTGDITVYYDGTTGPVTLSTNLGICLGPNDSVLVCDASTDVVVSLRDLNNDGDALDAGEATIYFDGRVGGNAQGTIMGSAQSLVYDFATGKLWIATASVTGALDEIQVVQDLNNDGDANDLMESGAFWTGASTAYLPQAVVLDAAGNIFYTENGTAVPKGVYQLKDLNNDGDANDAGEHIPFFLMPVTTPVPFIWSLEIDAQGWFYVGEATGDIVYRFKDLNNDGDASDPGESTGYFASIAASLWDTAAACDALYVSEGTTPQRIYRLIDANQDGVIGAGESIEMYIETGPNPVMIDNARGIVVRPAPCGTPSTPFCFGDGTGTACPCGNAGAAGNGCANSSIPSGAQLAASGVAGASLGTDTLVLTATNVPGPGLFFQGTTQFAGGAGITFGDGLLCAGGTITRMGVVFPVGTTASYPGGLTPNPIHIAGATASGDVRLYQCWYRDAAVFCSVATYNLTQGLTLTWGP